MRLWLIRPRSSETLGADNPWEPWYDKVFGFVVRAATEAEARAFAQQREGNETDATDPEGRTAAWSSDRYSTCEPLMEEDGEPGIVLRDFKSA